MSIAGEIHICIPKFKHKTPAPDPDTILQNVADRTKEFERAVGMARDQVIESTAVVSQDTNIRTTMIQWDVSSTKNNTEILRSDIEKSGARLESVGGEVGEVHGLVSQISSGMEHMTMETTGLKKGIDENTISLKKESENNERRHQELCNLIIGQVEAKSKIAKRESALEDGSRSLKNQLMTLLLEGKKKDAEIAMLKERLNQNRKRGAVVSLDRFCEILAQPSSTEDKPVDIERMFQHPNEDFRRALVHKSRFNAATQGQVQSLLRHERLHRWVSSHHPDLILVDANISSSGLSKVSAISVFCATLISSMMEVHPDEVVVQFFCGLHTAPLDPWHGPNGLVCSIAMQLLMKLVKMNILNLGFINNRDYLRDLEQHDLNTLCDTLYSLVSQFPADTRVYCIIDSVSWFDKDRTFAELATVMEWLQSIVEDRSLIPIFKIMLTNPMKSNRRMKELPVFKENPSRLVTLSSRNLIPMVISNRAIERQLSRSPSPSPLSLKKGVDRTARPESYDDDYDEW
ncbi:hypothetical protein RIB2604_02103410 [Aspergillus luchuensis]|uniref:Uncharacterized protein n=2 Tax=Aspergillus kawachii TaxID=1069201 RepID=A0A146FMU2_ASPKA|nr:hypothetical protein ALUC_21164A [Aspergillus luchuensis]GAT26659.1 hypothetical protein RIB2604_02103410 [Aspergillus luchuensis]